MSGLSPGKPARASLNVGGLATDAGSGLRPGLDVENCDPEVLARGVKASNESIDRGWLKAAFDDRTYGSLLQPEQSPRPQAPGDRGGA